MHTVRLKWFFVHLLPQPPAFDDIPSQSTSKTTKCKKAEFAFWVVNDDGDDRCGNEEIPATDLGQGHSVHTYIIPEAVLLP